MFAPLEKRSAALEDRLNGMSDAICDMYKIKSEDDEMIEAMDGIKSEVKSENEVSGADGDGIDTLWTPVALPKQSKVLCVGRICNEVRFICRDYRVGVCMSPEMTMLYPHDVIPT